MGYHKINFRFFAYSAIILSVYIFRIGGIYNQTLRDIIYLLTPIITLYLGYKAVKYFGIRSDQGMGLFYLTFSIFLNFLGSFFWFYTNGAIISVADIFWLPAYFVEGIAIFYSIKVIHPDFHKSARIIAVIFLLMAIVTAIYLTLVPIRYEDSSSIFEKIFTFGYLIGDIIQVMAGLFVIYIIGLTHKGIYSRAWIFIVLSSIIYWAGNSLSLINFKEYTRGDIVEVCWPLAYLFFAYGFFLFKSNAEIIIKSIKRK